MNYAGKGRKHTASSHKAHITSQRKLDNVYDHETAKHWPQNRPELNPMDYYVPSVTERKTNLPNTIASMKAAIVQVMADMTKEHLLRYVSDSGHIFKHLWKLKKAYQKVRSEHA